MPISFLKLLFLRFRFWLLSIFERMKPLSAKANLQTLTIRARVFRSAIGEWENLGIISRSSRRIGKWLQS